MFRKRKLTGFTLIEVMIAIMLIGVAITSLVAANGYLTKLNAEGIEMSTTEFLFEQMREYTAEMNFSSLESLNNKTYSPPKDATGADLTDFSVYSQKITVTDVTENDLEVVDISGTSSFKRITVDVLYNGRTITSASWLRTDY